jgi:hypothetical protein
MSQLLRLRDQFGKDPVGFGDQGVEAPNPGRKDRVDSQATGQPGGHLVERLGTEEEGADDHEVGPPPDVSVSIRPSPMSITFWRTEIMGAPIIWPVDRHGDTANSPEWEVKQERAVTTLGLNTRQSEERR